MISSVVVPLVVIAVLVLINGVFVAAEFALVGAKHTRLEALAGDGSRSARWLLELIDRPTGKDRYIAIAQLGITLASIGLGMYGEPAVAGWLYGPFEDWGLSYGAAHTVGFVIALSGITYLHVVLGEMIPKALALQSPERVIIRVNPVMRVFGLVFRPMVATLNAIALAFMRLLRIPEPDQRLALHTSAELAIVTEDAAESGQLGEMQREMIKNIFELDERRADELMSSRERMEVLDLDAAPDEVLARVASSARSRYPVVDGGLDRVVGVVHIKDIVRAQQQGRSLALSELLRPLPSVIATTTADQLLARFKRDRMHACLVVDEHGGTLGFITLDDVMAEVMDDELSDEPRAVRSLDGSLSIDGEVTLAELRDHHGIGLDHPDVTTVAGVLLAALGTIPVVGATVRTQGLALTVEAMDGHKVTRVRVEESDSPEA